LTDDTPGLQLSGEGIRTVLALLTMAVPAVAQIKPGDWNGHKVGNVFPSLSITLYESGEAVLGYNNQGS